MPVLELPDGAAIHWEERGAGPAVLIASLSYAYPDMVRGLIDDLSADHRVVVPDLRGTGGSSRRGPYDMTTDLADLAAVLEQIGGATVAIGLGDGSLRAVELAATREDLVELVLVSGYASFFRSEGAGTEALSGSATVLIALVKLLENDYRAAIRTIVETGNVDLDEAGIRERVNRVVAHCSHEAAVARMRAWTREEAGEYARALGDRLWILHHARNPWFPAELADRIPEFLPEAHLESVVDGAISRPELTAAVVRRITHPGASG